MSFLLLECEYEPPLNSRSILACGISCIAAARYGPYPTAAVQTGVCLKSGPYPGKWHQALRSPASHLPYVSLRTTISLPQNSTGSTAWFVGICALARGLQRFRRVRLMIFQTYSYYGQYAYVSITQVMQPLSLQILSNVLGLITGWLAVCKFLIDLDNAFQWANERF